MTNRRPALCGLAAGALALSLAAAASAQDRSGWPSSFTVGTASQGGTYFAYGSGWANLVAEELGISGHRDGFHGAFFIIFRGLCQSRCHR